MGQTAYAQVVEARAAKFVREEYVMKFKDAWVARLLERLMYNGHETNPEEEFIVQALFELDLLDTGRATEVGYSVAKLPSKGKVATMSVSELTAAAKKMVDVQLLTGHQAAVVLAMAQRLESIEFRNASPQYPPGYQGPKR